jgi:VanZ family protein
MTLEKPLRPVFALAAVVALVMALLPKPPSLPIDRFGDKFEHMLAFAMLALLARLAWRSASAWRILERLSFFGALIEVFQSIPALHRDCDPKDWVADTIAAAMVLVIASALRNRKQGEWDNGGAGR